VHCPQCRKKPPCITDTAKAFEAIDVARKKEDQMLGSAMTHFKLEQYHFGTGDHAAEIFVYYRLISSIRETGLLLDLQDGCQNEAYLRRFILRAETYRVSKSQR
jgi:hypothetical protein